jgi:hypothetical protein
MNLTALFKKQLSKIRVVLSCKSCGQRFFHVEDAYVVFSVPVYNKSPEQRALEAGKKEFKVGGEIITLDSYLRGGITSEEKS